ncbi:ribonuclease Z [Flavobacterium sp. PLA-1-15]|uniref:ribonuclease Z n=1 Tax=Flavobacterium sp. PLA-1-15 TaxID=3380533 RepID=UPI003B7F6E67
MKVETKGHTTTIKDTQGDLGGFLTKLTSEFKTFQSHNLIVDVSKYNDLKIKDIKLFSDLCKVHKKAKKSFVIVANDIDFNEVPAKMTVVPTLLEAHDIIEMEEIERDLGF